MSKHEQLKKLADKLWNECRYYDAAIVYDAIHYIEAAHKALAELVDDKPTKKWTH
jgi:hypothetical protein